MKNRSVDKLTEKQLNVWNYIREQRIVTTRQVREAMDIPQRAAFRILNKLLQMNRLKKLGANRGIRFVIHPLV